MNQKGIWLAVGAYAIWGIFPLYWKLLHHVPAIQLLAHRIVWSFACLLLVIVFKNRLIAFLKSIQSWRIIGMYFVAALMIGINWLIYVWAVNAGHIVETSLGYFINPLLSVLMGVLFLKERLRFWQKVSLALTAAAVLFLTIAYGALPWIALTLASSFAAYGLIKKIAPLKPFDGLLLETLILLIPAIVLMWRSELTSDGAFLHSNLITTALLIGAGVVTTIPLLMFASAAQRIPLSMVGILQYIAPTLQFIVGVAVYREPFSTHQLIGYSIVWGALLIFCIEGYAMYRRRQVNDEQRA